MGEGGAIRTEAEEVTIERRLREEVAPVFDAMKENPQRGISAAQVFGDIRALHAARLKGGNL